MKPIVLAVAEAEEVLCGDRTRLRRKVRFPGPYIPYRYDGEYEPGLHLFEWGGNANGAFFDGEYDVKAPYKAGDTLWVREKWRARDHEHIDGFWSASIQYADHDIGPRVRWMDRDPGGNVYERTGWRSPVCMPREAARLFLKVALVGAEKYLVGHKTRRGSPWMWLSDQSAWMWRIDFNRIS